MGYITNFVLNKIEGDDKDFDALVEDIKQETGLDFSRDNCQEAKWYNYEEDLCRLTKKYPNLIIQLDGNGENWDDLWVSRFRNGDVESFSLIEENHLFKRLATEIEKKQAMEEKTKCGVVVYVGSWELLYQIPEESSNIEMRALCEMSKEEIKAEIERQKALFPPTNPKIMDSYHQPGSLIGEYTLEEFEETFNNDMDNSLNTENYFIKIF